MLIDKYWKVLMWVTIVFLVVSIGILVNNLVTTGSILKRDVDLIGGKVITVQVDEVDLARLEASMPYASISLASGAARNLLVEIPFERNETEVISQLRELVDFRGEPSVRIVGPSIGNVFFQQAQIALIASFILMAITVFILFRSLVPSLIVIVAVIIDLVGTLAVLSVMDVSLSLPIIGALLALIGYSVGTDILLTSELMKSGRSEYAKSVAQAAKTGLTMTATAVIALLAMYFISGSIVIQQIALVLIIGLIIDMPATWFTNAGILRTWLERKRKGVNA